MTFVQIALPGAILFLAFSLKLFVDRKAEIPDLIAAVLELPVDISFLATSFVAAFIISGVPHAQDGLLYFIVYIVASVLVVVTWRRSQLLFLDYEYGWSIAVSALSYFICIYGLTRAINLVSGVPS